MTAIQTTCQCGQKIEFAEELAGGVAECPSCGADIALQDWPRPAANQPPPVPQVPSRPPPVSALQKLRVSRPSFWGAVCRVISILLFIPVGLFFLGSIGGLVEGTQTSGALDGWMMIAFVAIVVASVGTFLWTTANRLGTKLVCSQCGTDTTNEQRICSVCRGHFH